MDIRLSPDRKSATITMHDGDEEANVLPALICANVRDVLDQTKTAERLRGFYNACRDGDDRFSGLSEIAFGERLKASRRQLRSKDALREFVEAAMERNMEVIEMPEGWSFEEAVERDVRIMLALDAAK